MVPFPGVDDQDPKWPVVGKYRPLCPNRAILQAKDHGGKRAEKEE
jgi:hypothetical protein